MVKMEESKNTQRVSPAPGTQVRRRAPKPVIGGPGTVSRAGLGSPAPRGDGPQLFAAAHTHSAFEL